MDTEDWSGYIEAAQRKIRIARYHLERLQELHDEGVDPSIPQQACFEGVITAFVGATEQVAGAIHVASGASGAAPPLTQKLSRMPVLLVNKELERWNGHAIVRDVRSVRNRAAHRHYSKIGLRVQKPTGGTDYAGSRKLVPYCLAVVEHLECLAPLVAELKDELRDCPPRKQPGWLSVQACKSGLSATPGLPD